MQKLPIGIQSFEELRKGNNIYVDKTERIHNLMTRSGKAFFWARPRRFGKSLTLSTIQAIYEGKKELFEGLWIKDNWDWTKQNPVIHLAFNSMDYKESSLSKAISKTLLSIAKKHSIVLESDSYAEQFSELIKKIAEAKGKVVVLIDEYDKPIIDFLESDKTAIAKENREILRNFYSPLKGADAEIELFLMTGVSKFSQTGIFSNLNHLNDLTLHHEFSTLVGYTQQELEFYFDDYLTLVAKKLDEPKERLLENIKKWYNGYSWDGKNKVYNPFSVLLFLDHQRFEPHWFKTGSPKFLFDLIKNANEFDYNELQLSAELLDSYDIENLDIKTLLFQTGYLTIKDVDEYGDFHLDYPNQEVQQAMNRQILALMLDKELNHVAIPLRDIEKAFRKNDIEKVVRILNSLLKDIPSQLLDDKKEHCCHAVVHIWLRYLGWDLDSEVNTSDGRMDAVIRTDSHIYIIEFKVDKSAEIAFQQIIDKQYAAKYYAFGKKTIGIGINFSTTIKGVEGWKMSEI